MQEQRRCGGSTTGCWPASPPAPLYCRIHHHLITYKSNYMTHYFAIINSYQASFNKSSIIYTSKYIDRGMMETVREQVVLVDTTVSWRPSRREGGREGDVAHLTVSVRTWSKPSQAGGCPPPTPPSSRKIPAETLLRGQCFTAEKLVEFHLDKPVV